MKFIHLLPLWAQPVFKQADLDLKFEEKKMDCSACTFARGDFRDGSDKQEIYSANLKCCTFFPDLPNFAAGFELRKNPAIFDSLLNGDSLALPLGIIASADYKKKYAEAEFGTKEDLLCPHFDREALNCGIWNSRPASCVRFVCKSSLGEIVQEFAWRNRPAALGEN
jgi:hypothetical protein